MSYILDALKKSDEKRTQQIPTARGMTAHSPGHPFRYTISAWAMLFCIAVILLIWLAWPEPAAIKQPERDSRPSTAVATAITPPAQPWHHRQLSRQSDTETTDTSSIPLPQQPDRLAQQQPAAIMPDHRDSEPLQQSDTGTNIPDRSELPRSQLEKLPAIHIEGHIFDAQPDRRMVIINGQLCREKQSCGNGLILEEITADGVILSHEGTAFHISTFN